MDLPWEQLPGPPGGPVTSIAIAEANPDWRYATTISAGMFVSDDGGESWIQGTEAMHHRAEVWISPHDPEVAYTVFDRTTDGGRTWSTSHHGGAHDRFPADRRVFDLAFDPFDERTLYVGTDAGVHRSRDGGQTWTQLTMSDIDVEREARELAVHPEQEGRLLAAIDRTAVVRSDDRGESWDVVPGSADVVTNLPRMLTFTGPRAETAYLAINGDGVFRIGRDDPIELTAELPPLVFPHFGSPDPLSADGNLLYFIAGHDIDPPPWPDVELYVYDASRDEVVTLDTPEQPVSVTTHPTDASTVFFGGLSGVYESTDRGATWVERSNGFTERYLSTVETNPDRSGTVLPGTICSGGLFVSRDHGQTYEWKRSGLQPFHEGTFNEHYVMHIAAAGDRAYATTAAGLLISGDGGDSWTLLENEISGQGDLSGEPGHAGKHLHGLAVRHDDPRTVYVGTGLGGPGSSEDAFDGTFLWKTEDGGRSWNEITAGFPTAKRTVVQHILASDHDPATVYVGTNAHDYIAGGRGSGAGTGIGVYKSTNGGRRWEHLSSSFSNVHALAEDAADPGLVFAATPQGVFRSEDGGGSWSNVFPHATKGLLAHPQESQLLFAGAQKHPDYWDLFVSRNAGDTWAEAGLTIQVGREPDDRPYDGLDYHADYRPDFGQIIWLAFDQTTSYLYAATRGAGLWRAETSELLEATETETA